VAANPAQLRYLTDAVNTASPAQRIVMVYDRLVLDLQRAAEANRDFDQAAAAEHLRHAQQIIAQLRSSLVFGEWAGAEDLASIYGLVLSELIELVPNPDLGRLAKVQQIVSGLRDSWWQASQALLSDPAPPAAPASDPAPVGRSSWVG